MEVMPNSKGSDDDKLIINVVREDPQGGQLRYYLDIKLNGVQQHKILINGDRQRS